MLGLPFDIYMRCQFRLQYSHFDSQRARQLLELSHMKSQPYKMRPTRPPVGRDITTTPSILGTPVHRVRNAEVLVGFQACNMQSVVEVCCNFCDVRPFFIIGDVTAPASVSLDICLIYSAIRALNRRRGLV